jgi:hypothetical protein
MRSPQTRLRAVTALVVAGTLAVAASAVAQGLEPSQVRPVADAALRPVILDRGAAAPTSQATPASWAGVPVPSLELRPLADPLIPVPPAERPQPAVPGPKLIVVHSRPHSISGRASWYCNADDPSVPLSICHNAYPDGPGFDAYAAAGPGLRAALGAGWRNTVVLVCGRRCVDVRLVDWCKCTGGSVGTVKLIDLYEDVYTRTGGNVTIRW